MAKYKKVKKRKSNGGLVFGAILLLLGLFFLLSDLGYLSIDFEWIIFLVGVAFLIAYIVTRSWGLLIPGIIITFIGMIFMAEVQHLWYLFPLIVGVSFFSVYLTREKDTGWALIPSAILIGVSAVSAFEHYTNINSFPIIIIMIGAYLIYINYKK